MLKLTLPNGTIKEYPEGITLLEVGRELNLGYGRRTPRLCAQPAVFVFVCH